MVEGLLVLVIVGLLGFVGWYVWHAKNSANKTYNAANSEASSTLAKLSKSKKQTNPAAPATASGPATQSSNLKTYKYDQYGITITVPSDWQENLTDIHSAVLYGTDNANNFTVKLFLNRDFGQGPFCSEAFRDSEDLTYTNPLPGQNKTTKLTLTDLGSPHPETLCGIMITDRYSAKKGENLYNNQNFQAAYPTHRITAYVSNSDDATRYPSADTILKSSRYTELIAALKTLQLK